MDQRMDQKIAHYQEKTKGRKRKAKNLHPTRFELANPKILELESSPLDRSGMDALVGRRGIKI